MTYSLLEVKFLHLQNHSHHQRGASHASNSQEGVRVLEYKKLVAMQAPLVIKKKMKGGVQDTWEPEKAVF